MYRAHAVLGASFVGVGVLVAVAVLQGAGDEVTGVAAPVASTTVTTGPIPTTAPLPTTEPPEPTGDEPVTSSSVQEAPVPVSDCTLSMRLEVGTNDPEVACLESRLAAAGLLVGVVPDAVFDEVTGSAVEAFQRANGLVVDGVVGPQTGMQLGSWVGPDVLAPDPGTCADSGRSAVVDRFNQRSWLCEDGRIVDEMPMTSAVSQPDPGTYEVYAKDLNASSTLTGQYSTMTHFVAFTRGKYQGARIAFHSVPKYSNGEFVQPLDSVGTPEMHGDSSGCIRVLPDDAEQIWEWLDIGDPVIVVS
ncbi:MAG: L,D-transpeptidase family protein [Ilumatobacteraceae bacterium]